MASQSEISRKLEKSSLADKDELKGESRCVLSRSEIVQDEHPLSLGQSSLWNQFFQVNTLTVNYNISCSQGDYGLLIKILSILLCTIHIAFPRPPFHSLGCVCVGGSYVLLENKSICVQNYSFFTYSLLLVLRKTI